ncbi:MAG: DNA replication/repair protein RecF [Limnochordales bacterium]|nr:DNA replication/repair protein RecF [Limnochordales bacterium]
MWARDLKLRNFRNYAALELSLPPQGAVFLGENGQGKTNLLEAIYLALSGRPLRAGREKELIRWGEDTYLVRLEVEREEGESGVEVIGQLAGSKESGRRTVTVNGTRVPAQELPAFFSVVVFTPDHLELVKGSPGARRLFLDHLLGGASAYYRHQLLRYQRLLAQRNRLLKSAAGIPPPAGSELSRLAEPFTEAFIDTAARLLEKRVAALGRLEQAARAAYRSIKPGVPTAGPDGGGDLALKYEPAGMTIDGSEATYPASHREWREWLWRTWKEVQTREWQLGMSLLGPHRDDLIISADGVELRTYGSQGQQRSAVLALKLAEVLFLHEETGRWPVLLLDDVLSELDPGRRERFLEALPGEVQVIITSAEPELIRRVALRDRPVFSVSQGQVGVWAT